MQGQEQSMIFMTSRKPAPLGALVRSGGRGSLVGLAINVHDQVVGFSGPYAFLWTKATGMLNLNDLIDNSSGWQLYTATSINTKAQITGQGTLNGEEHGFLLTVKQQHMGDERNVP